MKRYILAAAAALVTVVATSPAVADTIAYKSTPADTWVYGRPGNDSTGDTVVRTTTAGDQLYLRWKQNLIGVPAGTGGNGVYNFTNDQNPLNFDWGFDTSATFGADRAPSAFTGITALITLTNLGTGQTFRYDPLFVGNDNYFNARTADDVAQNRARSTGAATGSVQNSNSLRFATLAVPLGYVAGQDGAFRVQLDVTGLSGGPQSLTADAVVGAGVAAVPEPTTWGLMLLGMGMVGTGLRSRRRRTTVTFA